MCALVMKTEMLCEFTVLIFFHKARILIAYAFCPEIYVFLSLSQSRDFSIGNACMAFRYQVILISTQLLLAMGF